MGRECLPVPTETKGDGVKRIATLNYIVTGSYGLTLNQWSASLVLTTIDNLDTT